MFLRSPLVGILITWIVEPVILVGLYLLFKPRRDRDADE